MQLTFWIGRQDDEINVTAHTEDGTPFEFVRFREGHPALTKGWTDEQIKTYLLEKWADRLAQEEA